MNIVFFFLFSVSLLLTAFSASLIITSMQLVREKIVKKLSWWRYAVVGVVSLVVLVLSAAATNTLADMLFK